MTDDYAFALTGGRWVVRRGIQVWTGPRPDEETGRMPARCGTDSGYHRHKRDRTPRCAPCKIAHAAAEARRNAA